MPHVIDAKGLLVLADRQDAVLNREVLSGEHQIDARVCQRAQSIDFPDTCVRMRRAQKFAMRHAGQEDVVGKARLPGHFCAAVDASARHADDPQSLAIREGIRDG